MVAKYSLNATPRPSARPQTGSCTDSAVGLWFRPLSPSSGLRSTIEAPVRARAPGLIQSMDWGKAGGGTFKAWIGGRLGGREHRLGHDLVLRNEPARRGARRVSTRPLVDVARCCSARKTLDSATNMLVVLTTPKHLPLAWRVQTVRRRARSGDAQLPHDQ